MAKVRTTKKTPKAAPIAEDAVKSSAKVATIVENPTFVKDLSSHAILNRDHSAYQAALKFRQHSKNHKKTVVDLSSRVAQLESLVQDLISQVSAASAKSE
jgi:hypothetical protein